MFFSNSNDLSRWIRNPNIQIKVFRNSEGDLAALVIPKGAYKERGFHVPREIPMEVLLQVGVNIGAWGDNTFRITEESVYKGHVHTPIDNP